METGRAQLLLTRSAMQPMTSMMNPALMDWGPGNELTFARYGLFRYVKEEKRKTEPDASLHRAGAKPAAPGVK